MTLESFLTHATTNWKKKQDTSIFGQVTVFFPVRPNLKLTFQFRVVSDRTRDCTPTPFPTAGPHVTAWSPFYRHNFYNYNFSLQQPLQIMHKGQDSNCNSWFKKWWPWRYLYQTKLNLWKIITHEPVIVKTWSNAHFLFYQIL